MGPGRAIAAYLLVSEIISIFDNGNVKGRFRKKTLFNTVP